MTDDRPQYITADQLDKLIEHLTERIDVQEELHAQLILAYTEMHATLVTLIDDAMANRDEEAQKAFKKSLDQQQAETLNMIQRLSREVERSGAKDASLPIVNMVGKNADPPSVE